MLARVLFGIQTRENTVHSLLHRTIFKKFNVVDSAVLVSLIGGGFGFVGILLNKIIKENRDDHGIVRDSLDRIETKIDRHLEGHE